MNFLNKHILKRTYKLSYLAVTLFSILFTSKLFAAENILNLYTWSGVIPDAIIRQFENETGIKVNFSTYNSNEIMYAKLRTNKKAGYDIVEPSSYYVDRMRRLDMLEKLDKTKLPQLSNINPDFRHQAYDPHSDYSIPFIWGITGIFINKNDHSPGAVTSWADLWNKKFHNQLLLLDDSREVFSVALLTLGYSANDNNPTHIEQAYQKLKTLMPNVKLFNSDAVITILVDEDTTIGMAWNGDLLKAANENPALDFIFPKDGFVIWVDNFVIPQNAPHRENAYRFLNFILRPEIAKKISLSSNFSTANLAAKKLLPPHIRNNPIYYPPHSILSKGQFQTDIDDKALQIYEKYWEKLKMGG